MNNESTFVNNIQCPKCAAKGNDKSGDNLAVYSDGHSFCWACGFYRPPSSFSGRRVQLPTKPPLIKLPEDCDVSYPQIALDWVGKYGFSRVDLLKQGVLWSEHGVFINKKNTLLQCKDVLVFPVWIEGQLMGINYRYFGSDSRVPKWIVKGKLQKVYHILPGDKTLVITEDIMSAMKVNRVGHESIPIYGMHAASRWKHLKLLGYSKIYLWLDFDMRIAMIKQARSATFEGLNVIPIFSELDPKCYNSEEIREWLNH